MVPPVPAGARDPAGATGRRRARAVGRLADAVRRLDVLLPGVRVRLLLPALDQRGRHVASRARQPQPGARRGVHRLHRAQRRPRDRRRPRHEGEIVAAGWRRRSRAWCSGWSRSRCSASSTPSQHFGPTDGGYASVFCAWTGFYLIAVLFTMYWLETQVATELRARRAPAGSGRRHQGPRPADRARARRGRLLLGLPGCDRGRDVRDAVSPVVLATAAATPGFWDWSFDPPLVLVIDLAIFYVIGARRTYTPERKRVAQRWRCGCFCASLAVLAIALASPIERLSADLFWVHMIQHVLLIVVAAPLLVLARTVDPPVALPAAGRAPLARGRAQPRRARRAAARHQPHARQAGAQLRRLLGRAAWLARARDVRRDARIEHAARVRAHAVLLHRGAVLEAGDPLGAAAHPPELAASASCS